MYINSWIFFCYGDLRSAQFCDLLNLPLHKSTGEEKDEFPQIRIRYGYFTLHGVK